MYEIEFSKHFVKQIDKLSQNDEKVIVYFYDLGSRGDIYK